MKNQGISIQVCTFYGNTDTHFMSDKYVVHFRDQRNWFVSTFVKRTRLIKIALKQAAIANKVIYALRLDNRFLEMLKIYVQQITPVNLSAGSKTSTKEPLIAFV